MAEIQNERHDEDLIQNSQGLNEAGISKQVGITSIEREPAVLWTTTSSLSSSSCRMPE
ncbi:hypothetical protein PHLCEN_2v1520 [Hermanssonia centrifuga]|uniref:Uncharacterized protein n=1 Tax=Hermanssonia centrifuga TaxID=98765 RepID=A0A2R6RZT4_9APHY|nr:hypothetical protein PHLCEN_2v1520 [Hermanssonia centrifuga]